jgi:hypothetical protein
MMSVIKCIIVCHNGVTRVLQWCYCGVTVRCRVMTKMAWLRELSGFASVAAVDRRDCPECCRVLQSVKSNGCGVKE